MNIYIDADGCPVAKETINVAKQFEIPVIIICDAAHYFMHEGAQTITVMPGSDAVDYEIINRLQPGDLVITQDYGLGALVLAKKGYAMNQNGRTYEDHNIDQLLFTRHLSSKLRQSGQRLKGPKKRTREDTQQFILALSNFLKSTQEGQSH